MPTYGVTSTGFLSKPLVAILADMQAEQLSAISASLNVSATGLIGILNGIVAQAVLDGWERDALIYGGMDPDVAAGDQLISLSLITGTKILLPTPTQVLGCTVNVNAGFFAAPGTMFASITGNPTARFTNKEAVSNPGGSPANETVDFQAVQTGPQQCLAGTLIVIAQPLSGWNSITNPNDGVPGTNLETDSDLRIRREEELSASGQSTPDAIRSAVLKQMVVPKTTTNTTSCTVLFNDSDATDANGLPPHSVEVIARQPGNTGADDLALATLLLNQVAAGIGTHGNQAVTVVDGQGNSESIRFTRPTDQLVYLDITIKIDANKFPANGDTLVQEALVAYGDGEYQPGSTVYASALQSAVFTQPNDLIIGVPGVLSVTLFKLGLAPSPGGTADIPIDIRSIAALSTSRIVVHHA